MSLSLFRRLSWRPIPDFECIKDIHCHSSSVLPFIPDDIFVEIGQHLSRMELLEFSMLSHHMWDLLAPFLYKAVELRSSSQCLVTLSMLLENHALARHIKKLAIQPNILVWAAQESGDEVNEDSVVSLIESLAESSCLHNLTFFAWSGLEVPLDSLWLSLRIFCPSLRNVYCRARIGQISLAPNSHLFEFSDLTEFSLRCKRKVWPAPEMLHEELWTMLMTRCPNLQRLFIVGPTVWRTERLSMGRWKYLKHLSVHVRFEDVSLFKLFFSLHPTLESVEEPTYSNMDYCDLSHLSFRSFKGTRIPGSDHPFASVEHLDLRPCKYTFSAGYTFLREQLRSLPYLVDLTVSVYADGRRQYVQAHQILALCPHLEKLTVVSSCRTRMSRFSNALRHCPNLKSFTMTKVNSRRKDSEDMTRFALHLVRQNTALREFAINYVREWPRVLKGSLIKRPRPIPEPPVYTHKVHYEVVGGDFPGTTARLAVREVGYHDDQRYTISYSREIPIEARRLYVTS